MSLRVLARRNSAAASCSECWCHVWRSTLHGPHNHTVVELLHTLVILLTCRLLRYLRHHWCMLQLLLVCVVVSRRGICPCFKMSPPQELTWYQVCSNALSWTDSVVSFLLSCWGIIQGQPQACSRPHFACIRVQNPTSKHVDATCGTLCQASGTQCPPAFCGERPCIWAFATEAPA